MVKKYSTDNNFEITPRAIVLKRILSFSKSYKKSTNNTEKDFLNN
jgi:hypothetical protein